MVDKYSWLFTSRPELPEGHPRDWEADHEAIASVRLAAVTAIYAQEGLGGLLRVIGHVEQPYQLGDTLGRSNLLKKEEDQLLYQHLAAEHSALAQFGQGFASGRTATQGRDWAETKFTGVAKEWSAAKRARLLACLPCDERTWKFVEGMDRETGHQYWRLVHPYAVEDAADAEHAVKKLLEHGRPHAAVDLIAAQMYHNRQLSAALMADALENSLRTSPEDDPYAGSSFSYHVPLLLRLLEKSNEIAESRLVALEWAYLPLLVDFDDKKRDRPILLHRELARNPDFFVEVVKLVYRAEGEEQGEATEEEQARAKRGYELLNSWHTVPGTTKNGTIDAATLKAWIQRARTALSACGRRAIGDQMIGQVLSGSPCGPDSLWPHPSVRDVIEEVGSKELESGFLTCLYNSRGVVGKSLDEGGAQERQLADKYAGFAAAISSQWPRTAGVLRHIERWYRQEALQEDQEADLREDLGL